MSLTIALRTLVVIGAIGASYVLVDGVAADHACDDANLRAFYSAGGFRPRAELEPALDDVRDSCEGGFGLIRAAEVLRNASVRDPSLAPLAVQLARESTRAEPDNYVSWATLAAALAPTDLPAARRSFARAKALNPRLSTPEAFRQRRSAPR